MSATAALDVRPLYPRFALDAGQPWRERSDWAVAPRLDHPDPEKANALALADLAGGADALVVVAASSPCSRGFGLDDAKTLDAALDGVELDLVSLRFDAGSGAAAFADEFAALVSARRLGSAGLVVDLGYDPVSLFARSGREPPPGDVTRLLEASGSAGLAGRPLMADARIWHEAGAEPARELALALATGAAHWRSLVEAGIDLARARSAVAVLLPFDADVLVGLAKARALRRLWARLETACGLAAGPLRLHAETSWRMMTRRDPWTNAMRATAAAFAAGLGGADAVTTLPMTLVAGLPDAAARRLARNTDRVLLDESGLGEVDDTAAGSGALEALTTDLCRAAWVIFQDVERSGGVVEILRSGTLAEQLALEAARRRDDVTTLARGIVGTSRFPSLGTPDPGVLDATPSPPPSPQHGLRSRRDAEPFESLRERADRGSPRVFLAALGSPAEFGAAAATAVHLLAAAGIASEPPVNERGRDETVAAFAACGSDVACLCGSAEAYAAEAPKTIAALEAAGARRVLIANGAAEGAVSLMPDGDGVIPTLAATLAALGL